MEEIRINKYIANSGICSRRNAENIILEGRVKINGTIVNELSVKVKTSDVVEVDNKPISMEQDKVYILLNKPKGYITTSKEQFGRPTVLDLVDIPERVFAIGRLDMDSEGMLLLTNDGEFANNIIHPTKHISKTYSVTLAKEILNEDILKLQRGIDIGEYITKPAIVNRIRNKNIEITIYEGKNRQVRKMLECVGNKVINLRRIRIGNLELGNLSCGQYKFLNKVEISKIFE